jgi:hypothetical protein
MRFVHIALCLGVVIMAVVLVLVRDPNRPVPSVPLVSYVGWGFAALAVVMAWVLPGILEKGWRRGVLQGRNPLSPGVPLPTDPVRLWAMFYQTRLIIRCALLEGATFFQLIAWFIEGQAPSLGVAAFLFLLLAGQFPTEERVTAWTQGQQELLEQERQGLPG